MKKPIRISIAVVLLCIIAICGGTALGAADYRVYLEDTEIIFETAPFVVNDRLLAPIRAVAEATGAKVDWDGKSVVIYREPDKLVLTIGSNIALYNDIEIPLDVAPVLKNGYAFLPLRFVAEWLSLSVNYDRNTIRLTPDLSGGLSDTMDAPRGNTNANLNIGNGDTSGGFHAITWRSRLFYRQIFSDSLVYEDLSMRGQDEEQSAINAVTLAERAHPKYFNIWHDQLYVNLNGDFVMIDEAGNILQTVIRNVGYCQIHDDWLYFFRESDAQFCRRLLEGGNVQPLGVYRPDIYNDATINMLEFVITDQHIYVNNGNSILRMNLDGSSKKRLLSININLETPEFPSYYYLNGLEYANGRLFFNLGGNTSQAVICQLNLDGTGLREVVADGAGEINIIGDWIYYIKLEPVLDSIDLGGYTYGGVEIARVKPDGSERKVLTHSVWSYNNQFSAITAMPDGSIYYCEWVMSNGDFWHKMKQTA